jgi:predicted transposase YbfD/YdcC
MIKVKSRRFHKKEWSEESRYFISSMDHNDAAASYGHCVRSHWGVENSLHWTLDMAFDEDRCRIHRGHADENMAMFYYLSIIFLANPAMGFEAN